MPAPAETFITVVTAIGSVEGSTGQYLLMLGQYEAVLVGTWWYWVSMERN